jgi:hypothetical protein
MTRQYPDYSIKIQTAQHKEDSRIVYQMIDSTQFSSPSTGLTTHYISEWSLDGSGGIDSSWTVRVDTLNGAIPWRRTVLHYHSNNSANTTYLITEKQVISYQSVDGEKYRSVRYSYTDGILKDSTIQFSSGENSQLD